MAINERLIDTEAAAANVSKQGLILHLDATDVDSYDGDGSVWYDISGHDVTIPLSDNADDLQLHLNASDSTSYGGSGTTWTDISGNSRTVTSGSGIAAADFDKDNGGYWNLTQNTSDYFSVQHHDDLHPTDTGGNTFEFWVYPNGGNDTQMFAQKQSSGSFDYYMNLHDQLGWELRLYIGGSQSICRHNADKTKGKWYHVVFTISSNVNPTVKLYLNGELKTTSDFTGTVDSNSDRPIEFGRYSTGNANDFNGRYGCVRYYSKVLSASEVGQNYRHGRDYTYTELAGTPFLHYDPANTGSYSGTGTTLTDLAGNNNADLLGGIESDWDEELGNSFPMTGSGDGITTSSTVSVNPATDGMTVEMWFRIRSNNYNYLFSFDGTETTRFGVSYRVNYNKIIFFYRESSGGNSNILSPTVALNKWHHVVATTDGSGAQIYLNGEVGQTTTSNAYNYTYNEDLHFGNLYDLAQNNNTDIGQIRFYKGHLTADEVMQNYVFTKNNYPNSSLNATKNGNVSWTADYFDFPGAGTDAFYLPDESLLLQTISISVWINPDTVGTSTRNIIETYEYDGSIQSMGWLFYFRNSGKLHFAGYDRSIACNIESTNAVISAGSWQHVVATVSTADDIGKLYVGGTEISSYANQTVNPILYTDGFHETTIGATRHAYAGGGESGFDGKMSKLRVYDRVLTQAEITALYNEGSGN